MLLGEALVGAGAGVGTTTRTKKPEGRSGFLGRVVVPESDTGPGILLVCLFVLSKHHTNAGMVRAGFGKNAGREKWEVGVCDAGRAV